MCVLNETHVFKFREDTFLKENKIETGEEAAWAMGIRKLSAGKVKKHKLQDGPSNIRISRAYVKAVHSYRILFSKETISTEGPSN